MSFMRPLAIAAGLFVAGTVLIAAAPTARPEHPLVRSSDETLRRGAYLSNILGCQDCHSGGIAPITEAQFVATLRAPSGPAPGEPDPAAMHRSAWSRITDEDLSALWSHLRSVPVAPKAVR